MTLIKNKGSTFWFTVQLEKQAGDAASPEGCRADLSDLRVLAVDDNATNRRILFHQLGAWQILASSAAGGQEALARLRSAVEVGQPYHLALLDVQMPEMDGLTLARAIKSDPALAGTRLIILTSFRQAFSPAELKAAGIEAYLVKPVRQSSLLKCLAKAVAENDVLEPAHLVPAAFDSKPSRPLEKLRILVADDYLSKPVRAAELQAALERGKRAIQSPFDPGTILSKGSISGPKANPVDESGTETVPLPPKQEVIPVDVQ